MADRVELLNAMRVIKEHCTVICNDCPIKEECRDCFNYAPISWDLEGDNE